MQSWWSRGVPRLSPTSLQVCVGPLSVALSAFVDSFSLCRKLCGQSPLHVRNIYWLSLTILILSPEVPFLWSENSHFCQKCPSLRPKKWHFEWPNQNSKTTFIVQTFPKYGPYGFDLVNLSLLGPILAKFQFCWFSGLFWPFFPCKWGQTRKSFAERQFLVYNAEIFFVNSYNPWAWVVKRTKLNSKKV